MTGYARPTFLDDLNTALKVKDDKYPNILNRNNATEMLYEFHSTLKDVAYKHFSVAAKRFQDHDDMSKMEALANRARWRHYLFNMVDVAQMYYDQAKQLIKGATPIQVYQHTLCKSVFFFWKCQGQLDVLKRQVSKAPKQIYKKMKQLQEWGLNKAYRR